MRRTYSMTYVAILDLLFKTKTINMPQFRISQHGGRFERDAIEGEVSKRLDQDFYVAASALWAECTPAEWYLVGRIANELKKTNALWVCKTDLKKNSSTKKAIRGLISKQVLFKTETTHIYVVNPIFIRRGDFLTVLNTTASLLQDCSKVSEEHFVDKKPVKEFDASLDFLQLQKPQTPQNDKEGTTTV